MHFGKSRIFLLFCLSFIVGVFAGNYLNYYIMAGMAMIFIILATLFWGRRWPMIVGFAGLILLAGAVRLKTSFPENDPNFVGKFYGQKVEMEGVVMREPDVRSDKVNLTIGKLILLQPPLNLPLSASTRQGEKKLSGNILLNVGKYPEYQYGDKLKVSGKLEEPFETEEFSYKDYLSRYNTYAVMRFPKIEKIGQGEGNPVRAVLLRFKDRIRQALSASLPEPHNALLLGIILGIKRALPEDLSEALAVVGVSHIVVISGFNISIFTKNVLESRRYIGRKAALWISFLLLLAFVMMTGAEASVIRAAIMGGMLILAMGLRRLYQVVNAIIFVAAIMVLENPKILSFDVGFQLSFLATLGLVYLSPILERWLEKFKIPTWLNFRGNLAATVAALTFTLPILISNFGRLSVVAIPVNVLILWVIPYVMYLGLVFGVLGAIWAPVVKLVSWLLWAMLEYILGVVEFFAALPFAAVAVKITIWLSVIYYLLLVIWLFWYRKTREFNYYLEYVKAKI